MRRGCLAAPYLTVRRLVPQQGIARWQLAPIALSQKKMAIAAFFCFIHFAAATPPEKQGIATLLRLLVEKMPAALSRTARRFRRTYD
jgi:hypothetical protein